MTQVFPTDDGFTELAGLAYDTYSNGYIRIRPKSTTETLDIFTTRGWGSTARLTDAYSPSGSVRVCGSTEAVASANLMTAFVNRELASAAAAKISLNCNLHLPGGGALSADQFHGAGVFARQSGGTPASAGTASSRLDDVSCYAFGLWNTGALGARYLLVRYNAGVSTVLTAADFNGLAYTIGAGTGFDLNATFDPRNPFSLRMELSDEAGNVRIKCFRDHSIPSVSVVELVNFLDTSGSKLTASGRFGFFLNGANTVTVQTIVLGNWWQAEVAGTVVLRDEFLRQPNVGTSAANAYGVSGIILTPLWTGEADGGYSPTRLRNATLAPLLNRAMIAPRVAGEGGGSAAGSPPYQGGYYQRRIGAADQYAARRSTVFYFSTQDDLGAAGTENATHFARAGIALRTGPSTFANPNAGYYAEISPGGTGSAFVKIWRFTGFPNGAAIEIADKSSGITIARDANVLLDFEVYNIDDGSGNPANAIVAMKVRVDAVQVVFAVGTAGISVDAAGTVYDNSSSRFTSGIGETLRMFAPPTINTRAVYADTFAYVTPTNPGSLPEHDQATIPVDGETDSATGTLVLPLEWPVHEVREGGFADRWTMEDAYAVTKRRYSKDRRVFDVQARACKPADITTLRAFWDSHRGCELGFSWAPPLEAAPIFVHFADDQFVRAMRAPNVRSFSFTLEELLV